jgi:two-component system cell cycle sensor histidine kinase/response regulator CckA
MSMAERPIRVLIAEDSPIDAELAEREVRRALGDCVFVRVDTRAAYLAALESFDPDVILSDYSMPAFDGLTALTLALERAPLTPVLIVTAAINEDTAVECMKAGAVDYVIKEHVKRLGPAVVQALEQRKVQVARRNAERDLLVKSFALESSAAAICLGDLEGRIFYANDAFRQLAQCDTRDELLGRSITEFAWTPEGRPVSLDDLRRTRRQAATVHVRRRDGSDVEVQASGSIVTGEDGEPICMMGAFVDLSERRRAEDDRARLEQQLEQARRMESIGQLAGGIAHDFNNMLTVVLGHVDLMKLQLPAGDPLSNDLLAVERAARRSKEMASQLLAFSRQQIIAPVVLDLNAHLDTTRSLFSKLIGEQVRVVFHPATALWPVKFDPSQIDQILLNLVVNARDAMPAGGTITVSTGNVTLDETSRHDVPDAPAGAYVYLAVRDEGEGIDEQVLSRIFEPFFTTKGPNKGTGLGLATVYGIVKQNGWYIRVETARGHGSTFRLYIPRAPQDGVQALPTAAAGAASDTAARRSAAILLVEDDDMVRQLTTKLLASLGYAVHPFESPSDALECIAAGRVVPDLLLTDVIMPGMSGLDLRLQLTQELPGLKTVFMSGHISHHAVGDVLTDRAVRFVQKPFSKQELDGALQDLLRRPV